MSELVPMHALLSWRNRHIYDRVSATNGCFDLLHAGHVDLLEKAKVGCDRLIVGMNSDASVQRLKGSSRPIICQADRARMLLALRCVDAVCIFDDMRADRFLAICKPTVYVKGGDYTLEKLDAVEREELEKAGAEIYFVATTPKTSTSSIVDRIKRI